MQRDRPAYRVVTVGADRRAGDDHGRPADRPRPGARRPAPRGQRHADPARRRHLARRRERAFAGKAAEFLDAGVPVAAICGATAGLAAEGLLDDRRHTSNAAEFLAATGYGGADATATSRPSPTAA